MTGSNGDSTSLYEQKFAGFIDACEEANSSGTDLLLIAHPEALGDNYEEIVESLNRLADAGLNLTIVPRKERT
jgi:hypothetical protein